MRSASAMVASSSAGSPPPALPLNLSRARLMGLLGGPSVVEAPEVHRGVWAQSLVLQPGEVLFQQGQPAHHVYLIEQGLLQLVGQQAGAPRSVQVSYLCARDLTGLHNPSGRRPATAVAVTHTRLLAFALDELLQDAALGRRAEPDGDGELDGLDGAVGHGASWLRELIYRSAAQTLKGELREVCRLRELPARERALSGLAHLARMACAHDPALLKGSRVEAALDLRQFQHWLGLTNADLFDTLVQLVLSGDLVLRNHHVVAFNPRKAIAGACKARPRCQPAVVPAVRSRGPGA